MYYEMLVIVLHRPFCSKRYIQPQPLVGRGPQHAREMCIHSAVNIAKLLSSYKEQYTLRRANVQIVHCAFTAALILVYTIVSGIQTMENGTLSPYLHICCKALAAFGEVFESANRALDVLVAVKRSWEAKMAKK